MSPASMILGATPLQRTLARFTLAAILLALVAFGVAEESASLGVSMAVAAVVGWALTEPNRSGHAGWAGFPRWVTGVLLVVILVASVYRVTHGTAPVSAFETFLASIIVIKMWERRQVRDYRQVLALAVFLVIGATLNATSIWIGAVSLAMLPVLLLAVLLYQVVAATDGAASPMPAWSEVRGGLSALVTLATVLGLGVAVTVFLIVPRGEEFRRFGLPHPSLAPRVTAFTDEVDLTRGGLISESQAKVLDLRVRDDLTGAIIGGEGQRFYLRGVTLTQYASGRWERASAGRLVRTQMYQSGQVIPVFGEQSPGKVLLLEINSRGGPTVDAPFFTMQRPLAVYLGEVDRPIKCTVDVDTGDAVRSGRPESISYRVRAAVTSPPPEPNTPAPGRESRVVFASARIHSLAERVLREQNLEPDPLQREPESDIPAARRIESFLRANYTYSLSPGTPPLDADPIEYFLFTSKRGHCEYFASALTAMCRSVGVNARLVAGYLATEYDESERRYIVRESAAHAWVEAQAANGAWVTLDATPPSQFQAVADSRNSLWARLGRAWERVEAGWNRSVTSFDESTQHRLWRGSDGDASPLDRLGRIARGRRSLLPQGRDWWGVAAGLSLLAAAALVAWWKRRRARLTRSVPGGAGWALRTDARDLLAAMLGSLASRGERREPSEPLAEFVRGVATRHPDIAPEVTLVAETLYRDVFDPDPQDRARAMRIAWAAIQRLRPHHA